MIADDIWVTSDLHLGHSRILEFCGDTRQGSTVEEHDEIMIEQWNSVVKKGDVVFILGDECLGDRDEGYKKIARLNGAKHLIKGNHTQLKHQWQKDIFQSISDIKKISVKMEEGGKKQQFIMCHFPILSWENMRHGSILLYGHCHGSLRFDLGRAFDVGIDTRPNKDMRPWKLREVYELVKDKVNPSWDHH